MTWLQTLLQSDPATALAISGALIGLVFGAVAGQANFCVMGAVSDWRTSGSIGRLGALALAMSVAIAGAQALDAAGITDLSRSMYLTPRINWAGAILGGLVFGIGMVFAGGCASRNLVRAGRGDLRSLIVLVTLSIAAFATISGVLAPLRDGFETSLALMPEQTGLPIPSLAALAGKLGLASDHARLAASALLMAPLLYFAFARAGVQREPLNLLGGLGVGALVVAAWMITGLAFDDMAVRPHAPTALSFVRPVADTTDWLERATALGLPGFGAASVLGALAGSLLAALFSGNLRVQGFAGTSDLVHHVGGAIAMGIGGVLALGCSIGQGLSGLSTLSLQSLLAITSILAGAVLGLHWLERRL